MANGILFSIGIYNLMIWFDLEPKYKVKFIRTVINALICTLTVFAAVLLEKDTWLYVAFISGIMIGLTQHQKREMYEYIYKDMKNQHKKSTHKRSDDGRE